MRFVTLTALLAGTASGALAQETVSFSLPAPISAYSGGPGVYFHLPLSITVPFSADERPDLVAGLANAPNPAYPAAQAAHAARVAAYQAALAAYDANRAAREVAQRALDVTYPALLAAYEADLATYRLCRRVPLAPCGSEPQRPGRPRVPASLPLPEPPADVGVPETIDTRTGPTADFAVVGQTSTILEYRASLGTLDPTLTYDLSLDAPDPVPAGELVQLRPQSQIRAGTLDATSPSYRVTLGQSLRIDRGEIAVGACVLGAGCAESGTARAEVGEVYVEIFETTPQGTTFFGQTLPERFIRSGLPGLELEVMASLNIDADDTANPFGISVNGFSIPPEFTIGVSTEAATGRLTYPVLEIPGTLDEDGLISGSATSDFISLDIDVDTATGLIGGASVGNDLVSVGADLWDVTAGPRLRPYQEMALAPTLWLTLEFDQPVEIDGLGEVRRWHGRADAVPALRLRTDTHVTPTWEVTAVHNSRLGLSFLAEIEVELIIAEMNILGSSTEFGPFAPVIPVMASDAIDFPLTQDRFDVTGFSAHRGAPVLLRVAAPSVINPWSTGGD